MHIDILQLDVTTGPNAEQAPQNFFTSRFFDDNKEFVEEVDPTERLFENLDEILREEQARIERKLDEFDDDLRDELSELLFLPVEGGVNYFRREIGQPLQVRKFSKDDYEVILLNISGSGRTRHRRFVEEATGEIVVHRGVTSGDSESTYLLISDDSIDISQFINYFQNEVEAIDDIVGDFMNLKSVKDGEDIVRDYFEGKKDEDYVTDWYTEETDDEFEQEVYESVDNLTGVCLPNVNVESSVGESPEYDVVTLPVGPSGQSYAVEAKDYDRDQVDDDLEFGNLRYNLITQPKEDADRVDLDLITVVRGLEDDQFENLKRHADASNVILLNEEEFESTLREVLIEQNLRELIRTLE